jgi:hypothetical protein
MWSLEKWLASGAIHARGRFPKKILLSKPVMDEKISDIFQEWMSAFDAMQVASGEEAVARAHSRLSEIETQLANTPGEGMRCLVIKLGLHRFLSDHANAASLHSESAYRDLVRLTGYDPTAEICARFRDDPA